MRPRTSPPRCACQAMFGMIDSIRKPMRIAAQSGRGTTKNMRAFACGRSTAIAPITANIAPEAPMSVARFLSQGSAQGAYSAQSMKKAFPSSPPRKYMVRNFTSPISVDRYVPKKNNVIMLKRIWKISAWIKRLVTIFHGSSVKLAACSPRRHSMSEFRVVAMNNIILTPMRNHTAFRVKPRFSLILPYRVALFTRIEEKPGFLKNWIRSPCSFSGEYTYV